MPKRILKYRTETFHAVQKLSLPKGAEILLVNHQESYMTIWALVDEAAPLEQREFLVMCTGDRQEPGTKHIGSYINFSAYEVIHVFEREAANGQG